jgi:hypothetical protein
MGKYIVIWANTFSTVTLCVKVFIFDNDVVNTHSDCKSEGSLPFTR